jgi:chromosome partitioning protein
MALMNSKLARESLPSELAMDQVIQGDARALSGQLQALREKLFAPEAKKDLATV